LRVILLFLDGVGIGKRNLHTNPFVSANIPALKGLLGGTLPFLSNRRIRSSGAYAVPVNATLRIPGLPQSGTGQTAIFTGVNGAKVFGRHFGPYPPTILRPIIESKNIFRQLRTRGKTVCFANAFPQRFFDYTSSGTRRLTVTTLACLLTGIPLLTARELSRNEGVSADFTRTRWPELGHPDIQPVTPRDAGHHLWHIAENHDFTLFEYWLTDHAGHSQKMESGIEVLENFDQFLQGFLEDFSGRNSLLVMISDHGNLEDLSVKTHTRNPVPCVAAGQHAHDVVSSVHNLTHITPAILKLF
jgi:2,3-bisphosphoglycerate-independent phosphoglycerate mutase